MISNSVNKSIISLDFYIMNISNCLFLSCSLKMHLYLFQKIYLSISILIVSLILTCIPYSSGFAQYNDQYMACNTSFNCSNMEVRYPFWESPRPEYCGHPEFELSCSGEAPVITISSLGYRVLEIDPGEYLLKVARTDYWNNNCPEDRKNASLNLTFSYASDTQDLTLYYGCPGSAVSTIPNQFSCPGSGTTLANYYATDSMNALNVSLQACEESAIVRISDSAAGDLEKGTTVSPANLTAALDSGFGIEWDANNSRCEKCVKSEGVCGFNLTTGEFTCYCKDRPYGFMWGSDQSPSGSSLKRKYWIIGISAALSGFIIFSVVLVYYCRKCKSNDVLRIFWKKNKRDKFNIEAFISEHGSFAPERYSYAQVKRMTNSFAEKIGKGGYGAVYKGKLSDGRLVAVKVLHESKTSNGEEFINEVASIGRTSHVNIVTLLGFCYERTKSALVYEYMPNGSLEKFIFNQESSSTNCHLEWKTLYEIAIGIARGLAYLHRGCNTRILHLDIKPQNILLDKDFCPKISDFGLAKLCQTKESIVSMVGARGTIGYIAPEVFSRTYGGVSHKSDVYSYGMLVLEMVGGRKNFDSAASHTSQIYFPNQLFKDIEMGNEASMSENITAEEKEISRKMVLVSFWCIQTNPADRPPMSKVVDMLEGTLESIEFPPKPYLFSPTRSP